MDRGRGRLARVLCHPPHPVPAAGGSRDALQSLLAESDGSGDVSGETTTGQLAMAPAPTSSWEKQRWGGTSSRWHPPNLFVLPCCLPRRLRNFPCSEHRVPRLYREPVFVAVLTPALRGVGTRMSFQPKPLPPRCRSQRDGAGGPRDVGMGSRPVPACLGALGKKQLGNSQAQLVYR